MQGATRRRRLLESLAAEAEMRRCKQDKRHFINTYWHIPVEGATGGRALFKFWDFQEEAFDALQCNKRVIVAKTRQLGMTTLSMADTAHGLLFSDNRYEALVVSWREDIAQATLSMVEFGYTYLPGWMKARLPKRDDRTKERITFRFKDGRTTAATAFSGTPRAGASRTATRVILDEFGLMDGIQGAVYRAVEPTTMAAMRNPGNQAVFIIVSTARGNRNQFSRLFWDAWDKKTSWKGLFYPVQCNKFLGDFEADPDRFWASWEEKRQEYAGEEHKFYAEYPRTPEEAFRESGRGRFPHIPELADCPPFEVAGFLVREGTKVRIDVARSDLDMDAAHIWLTSEPKDVDRTVDYVISADPSGGVGRDFHAAQVMCHDPEVDGGVRIVGYIHRNDIDPTEFADWLDAAGRFFTGRSKRPATIVVERNENSEGEVLSRLRQRRYPNLFRYSSKDRPTERLAPVYGWPINRATKPEAINALARLMVAVPDVDGGLVPAPKLAGIYPELRDELVNYVVIDKENGRVDMRADGNGHDDLVSSTAIGCAVLERLAPRRSASVSAPTGEAVLPDGPFTFFDPAKVLSREIKRAERVEREQKREWRRLEQSRRRALRDQKR
jgi:hypothetical protein